MKNGAVNMKGVLTSIECGVLSFVIELLIITIPATLPDLLWMTLMILMPTLVAIYLFKRNTVIHPGYIWVGLPAQYLLFFIFSKKIAAELGINVAGIGGFEYIFFAAIWPFAVTLIQSLSLVVMFRKNKNK